MTDERLSTPGARIRLMREAKGLKQTALAKELGTSQPAISQWEKNKWLPGPHMRTRIAMVLGASESFLFGDVSERKAAS